MNFRTGGLMVCLAVALVGCSSDTDESEHVHHSFPDHKPANLQDAVAAISSRAHVLAHHGGKRQSGEFQEFVEIVKWVPELAADSDLDKTDWESANAAADRMLSQAESQAVQLADLEDAIGDELKQLRDLVSKAGTPEPDLMHRGHGHGHGHMHNHGDGSHSH